MLPKIFCNKYGSKHSKNALQNKCRIQECTFPKHSFTEKQKNYGDNVLSKDIFDDLLHSPTISQNNTPGELFENQKMLVWKMNKLKETKLMWPFLVTMQHIKLLVTTMYIL